MGRRAIDLLTVLKRPWQGPGISSIEKDRGLLIEIYPAVLIAVNELFRGYDPPIQCIVTASPATMRSPIVSSEGEAPRTAIGGRGCKSRQE